MHLRELRLRDLRNIATLDVALERGISIFIGANGAGKTSILEGAYLLSHAESFRASRAEVLIRRGAGGLSVYAEVERRIGPVRLGLARRDSRWEAAVNGAPAANLGALLREFALVCFEPGSHSLISGSSLLRRRFLDWSVFHVEPDYWLQARRYQRALRQRNAWLRQPGADSELEAWDAELALTGTMMAAARERHFANFAEELQGVLAGLLPELGEPRASLHRGWPEAQDLAGALRRAHGRDRQRGHTTLGPHRADWNISFALAPGRDELSRGQEKLCALACVLAQARWYAREQGEWPVVVLDDFASELDIAHQTAVARLLAEGPDQILVSGIEVPESLRAAGPLRVFHVEHGMARCLV